MPEPVEGLLPEPVEGLVPEPVEGLLHEPVEGRCLSLSKALEADLCGGCFTVGGEYRIMNIECRMLKDVHKEGYFSNGY